MDTKLTLSLNKSIIEQAKLYAKSNDISLSRLIESYLKSLTTEKDTNDLEISPFVKSISTGINMPTDIDYKKEYTDHLMQKYK